MGVLPVAGLSAALAILGEERGPRTLVYAFKPLTTALILLMAVTAEGADPRYRILITAGLAASLAGDVFLMLPQDRFTAGLASFLAAHVTYAAAFATRPSGVADGMLLLALLAIAAGIVGVLWAGLGRFRGPVVVYVAAIMGMAWLACIRWRAGEAVGAGLAAVGALSFVLSDALLALDRFRRPFRHSRAWVLASYYAAQALIALSVGGAAGVGAPGP